MSDIAQTTILSKDDNLVHRSSTIGIEASLKIISGAESNTFQINKETTIGRASPSDLVIAAPSLSKQHAKIIINNGQFFIIDLNSSNKTFQNKIQLQPNVGYALHNGDEIKMGDIVCSYHDSTYSTEGESQSKTISESVAKEDRAESMNVWTENDDDLDRQCPMAADLTAKEFVSLSAISTITDFNDQYELLQSAGLNVERLIKDYHRWSEDQDGDVLDYLFSIDDEKCLVYISEKLLFQAKKLTDDHGCGAMGVAKEIIAYWIMKKNDFPSFFFDEKQTEEFVKQSVTCSSYGQMQTRRDIFVYMIKTEMKPSCKRKLLDRLQMFDLNDERYMFLYHGTTETSAQSIITNGIRLKSRNSRLGDFGFGFYMIEDLDAAIHRAEIKAERTLGRETPAVLIFQLTKEEFNRHAILRLQYAINNQGPWIKPNTEDITNDQVVQWPIFVYLCLTNNSPEQFIDQFDCIMGPTSSNSKEIIAGNKPQIKTYASRITMQVAIISTTLKHALMNGLKAVIIWEFGRE